MSRSCQGLFWSVLASEDNVIALCGFFIDQEASWEFIWHFSLVLNVWNFLVEDTNETVDDTVRVGLQSYENVFE